MFENFNQKKKKKTHKGHYYTKTNNMIPCRTTNNNIHKMIIMLPEEKEEKYSTKYTNIPQTHTNTHIFKQRNNNNRKNAKSASLFKLLRINTMRKFVS